MADAWKPYIDNMQASGLHLSGIFGKDGQPYSMSPKMHATQPEMKAVIANMAGKNFTNGIVIGGKKYTVINSDADWATAKCRNADNDDEKYLLHIAMSNTLVVVGGICGPNERAATGLVENIRDYLLKSNY